ncbi:leucine-rich repeat protein [Butyrivibrio sp. AE2032]|uniref:leucine-rich repeat protein n=1 Tax=Butyrivibrio sp. AE2032 TaxID=1458463 RepID=UPI0006919660|nr:leucine-rich repeat protein [Butyrivibrio sp. AE2032]
MRKSLKLFCSVLAAVMMLSVFSAIVAADSTITASGSSDAFDWQLVDDEELIVTCHQSQISLNIAKNFGNDFDYDKLNELRSKVKTVIFKIGEGNLSRYDLIGGYDDYNVATTISISGPDDYSLESLTISGFPKAEALTFPKGLKVGSLTLRMGDNKHSGGLGTLDVLNDISFDKCKISRNENMKNISVPASINEIIFERCYMENAVIESGREKVGSCMFWSCWKLADVTIPNTVTSIEYAAFFNCRNLETIDIPDSVSSIGPHAFAWSGLKEVSIPSGVTYIEYKTFDLCEKLKTVSIPESVECIDADAFTGCKSLTDVYYEGTEAQWNKIEVDPDGKTLKEVFNNATIHFNGEVKKGWVKDGDFWMYYKEDGNPVKNDWLQLNGKWYHFNEEGYMAFDFTKIGNDTYYFKTSGEMVTGWLNHGKYWYYLNTNGKMATGWKSIGGKWYFFQNEPDYKPSGIMLTGWQKIDGKWYYMDSVNGDMKTGWQPIGGKWYYLKSDGVMVTGWLQLGNTWYYLKSDGAMVTGWQQIGGKWYYLDPSNGDMKTGWLQLGSKWYYLKSSGEMATGKLEIGGKMSEFDGNGVWKGYVS